jgi:hypothetical protein
VKFFVNVFDTDDDDGPFTFIPADESTTNHRCNPVAPPKARRTACWPLHR